MLKEFLMKKLIASKLAHLPAEDRDRILSVVTKNPKLFEEIAVKIKHAVDSGEGQQSATMRIMREYQGELKKAMEDRGD